MNRLNWIWFIARRHFRTRRREKGHTAAVLAVSGLAVGVMTLVAVLAVMNGFQLSTIEGILEVNSYHLRIESREPMPTALVSRFGSVPGVSAVLPFVEVQSLGRGLFGEPQASLLRGVPQDALERDAGLAAQLDIVLGEFDLSGGDTVVLGAELARALGVSVGDSVSFLTLSSGRIDVRRPRESALYVTGLFRSGFLDYDRGWGFISLDTAVDRFEVDEQATWGIKLHDRFADRRAAAALRTLLAEHGWEDRADVVSWRSFNRAIFGALRVEKLMISLLIGLIFVVVGANIYQALRRSVSERTEEIAVIKAIGAPPGSVRLVFVIEGLIIGLVGGGLGMAAGLAVSVNINEVFAFAEVVVNGLTDAASLLLYPFGFFAASDFSIFSPTYFYIEEVPSRVFFWEAAGIFLFAFLSAGIAALGASAQITRIKPSDVLRYQ